MRLKLVFENEIIIKIIVIMNGNGNCVIAIHVAKLII